MSLSRRNAWSGSVQGSNIPYFPQELKERDPFNCFLKGLLFYIHSMTDKKCGDNFVYKTYSLSLSGQTAEAVEIKIRLNNTYDKSEHTFE